MKALKLILLSSVLLAGLSANANTSNSATCPHVADGQKVNRDDAYANPNNTRRVLTAALGAQPQTVRPTSGQNTKVAH